LKGRAKVHVDATRRPFGLFATFEAKPGFRQVQVVKL
jgi:hypothetical protein